MKVLKSFSVIIGLSVFLLVGLVSVKITQASQELYKLDFTAESILVSAVIVLR